MRNLLLLAPTLCLLACGGGPVSHACEDYGKAVTDCYAAAGFQATGATGTSGDDGCGQYDGYDGSDGQAKIDQYECMTDIIESGDCSSATGATDAVTEALVECGDLGGATSGSTSGSE